MQGCIPIDIPDIGIGTILYEPFDYIGSTSIGSIMQKSAVSVVFAVNQIFIFLQHLFDRIELILSGSIHNVFLWKNNVRQHQNEKKAQNPKYFLHDPLHVSQ